VAGQPLRLFNHHADTDPASRRANLTALQQIVSRRVGSPTIVLGDFNETPEEPGVRTLIDAGFVDAAAGEKPKTTNQGRIDYLLVDPSLAASVRHTTVWNSRKSDHYAFIADLRW